MAVESILALPVFVSDREVEGMMVELFSTVTGLRAIGWAKLPISLPCVFKQANSACLCCSQKPAF